MSNPYVNKVLQGSTTLIDLTSDTVTASDMLSGVTAHDASGAVVTGTIADGDELEYGSAGLSGTTWYFNSSVTLTSGIYSIDFTSNSTSYDILSVQGTGVLYGSTLAYFFGSWQNTAYRTISITGGTDANNADLIAWIQANATQQ